MKYNRLGSVAAIAFVAGMLVQCGPAGQDCTPGEEGCECVLAACNGDLQCRSAICVDLTPGDTSGEPTSGATDPTTDPTASTDPTATDPTATMPTTDPTDPTGATDDAGETTNPTGATTVDPPVCGDGKVDAGESCDDGNQVDDDLCNNDCQPGGGRPSFALIEHAPTMVLGGKDGPSFGEECNGALRGISGSEEPAAYILAVQGECSDVTLVDDGQGGYVLELEDGAALPSHGVGGATAKSVVCPAGEVVIGFHAYLDSLGVSGFQLLCSPLTVDANTLAVKIGAAKEQPLFGGMGTMDGGELNCPGGHIATGILGFLYTSDDSLIGLGLHCAKPVVQ